MKRQPIVKDPLLFELREAHEALGELIRRIEEEPDEYLNEDVLKVEFEHIYHHLNTAWNGRYLDWEEQDSDEMFHRLRRFPKDIRMHSKLWTYRRDAKNS